MLRLWVRETPKVDLSVSSPTSIFNDLKDLREADQETFWVYALNDDNRVLLKECLFKGGIDFASVDVKLLLKRILCVGATQFVVVHNHPSGSSKPSGDDDRITKRLARIAKLLSLDMLDHIIIGTVYFSYKESAFHYLDVSGEDVL